MFECKEETNKIEIEIHSKKKMISIIFMIPILIGWLYGEYFLIPLIFKPEIPIISLLFLFFFVLVWTLLGLSGIVGILWIYDGREYLVFEKDKIQISRKIFNFGINKIYESSELKKLQIDNNDYRFIKTQNNPFLQFIGLSNGKIKLDFGTKKESFGYNLYTEEADEIITKIKNKNLINENLIVQ